MGYTIRNRDARQAGAVSEGSIPDAGDAIRNGDVGQACAADKGAILDASDAITNRNARQAGAACEGVKPDPSNAITNRDARQAGAIPEGKNPNAGNAVRNRDARQAGAALEGSTLKGYCSYISISNARDRIPFNGIWYNKLASSSPITIGDGDFPIRRSVSQVIQIGSVERQEGTGKERKKGLKRFHDALALPYTRRQVKLETG